MAGHASQIPNPGDFLVARMDRESAIVVRGADGAVRAFANVCRHRGSLICLQDSGNVRKFECPYHGWMYNTDGTLAAARSMPEGFDRSSFSLHELPFDDINGMLFVSFGDDPLPFEAAKRDLAEPMALFDFGNMKVAAKKTYPIAANWKLAIENYQECYHCASAHPDYAKMHTLMLDPARRDRLQDKMLARFDRCGLKPILTWRLDRDAPPGQSAYAYGRTALFEGYKTGSRDGEPVAPLLGQLQDYDGGASDWVFGPFTFMLSYSDYHVVYVFTPTDARNCQCEVYWMVRADAKEGVDFQVDEVTWLWDVTTQADETIIVNNWNGVNSRFYAPGPFSTMERSESNYIEWLVGELRRSHGE
jgi:Rieske 2Fe-2S family protein